MGKYNKEKYYYFQLKSTFFDNDAIANLESMENGYEILILYFKLIFKTINKEGKLVKKIGNEETPYTFEELSFGFVVLSPNDFSNLLSSFFIRLVFIYIFSNEKYQEWNQVFC